MKAIHCTDSGLKIVHNEIVNGSILVTTWRDIDEIYKCWGNRETVGRHPPKQDDLTYFESWYRLFRWEPVVVSLDTDRVERLAFLSHILGIELKADWESVNATPKKKYDIRTDSFTEDMCTAYAFAVDAGYQGMFDEYKAWRARDGGVVNEPTL